MWGWVWARHRSHLILPQSQCNMNVHFVHVRKAVHTHTQQKKGRMLFSAMAWLPLPNVKLSYTLSCAVSWLSSLAMVSGSTPLEVLWTQRAANTDNSELKVSSQCITVWYCKNWTSFLVLVWRLLRLVHVIVVLFTLDLTLVTLAMFSDIHVTHNPWSHLSCSAIESKDSILVRSVVEYCQCLTANGISLAC